MNYTFRMEGVFSGHAESLFADLAAAQEGRYSTFLDLGGIAVCSASPDLFFERAGQRLVTRPMKGTAPWGRTLEEDRRQAEALHASAKERAENMMIVDMMRNDLGRVRADFDDMILWSPRGEVTEATKANVVVERRAERLTPPIAPGRSMT